MHFTRCLNFADYVSGPDLHDTLGNAFQPIFEHAAAASCLLLWCALNAYLSSVAVAMACGDLNEKKNAAGNLICTVRLGFST